MSVLQQVLDTQSASLELRLEVDEMKDALEAAQSQTSQAIKEAAIKERELLQVEAERARLCDELNMKEAPRMVVSLELGGGIWDQESFVDGYAQLLGVHRSALSVSKVL